MSATTPNPRRCLYTDEHGTCRRFTITDNDYCITHQIHAGRDVEKELASVLAKVDRLGKKQVDFDAKEADLATGEASLTAKEGRINARDADLLIREWGLDTRERDLNKREAELNARSRDMNLCTEGAENATKYDENEACEDEKQDLAFENVTLRNWLTQADADNATALEERDDELKATQDLLAAERTKTKNLRTERDQLTHNLDLENEKIQQLEARCQDHDSEAVANSNKIAALEEGLRRMTAKHDALLTKHEKLKDAFDAKWSWTYGTSQCDEGAESSDNDAGRTTNVIEQKTATIGHQIQARIDKVNELGVVIRAARDRADNIEGELSAAKTRAKDAERKAESSEAKYEAYRAEARRLRAENQDLKDRNIDLVVQAAEQRILAAEFADRVRENADMQTAIRHQRGTTQLAAIHEGESESDVGNSDETHAHGLARETHTTDATSSLPASARHSADDSP